MSYNLHLEKYKLVNHELRTKNQAATFIFKWFRTSRYNLGTGPSISSPHSYPAHLLWDGLFCNNHLNNNASWCHSWWDPPTYVCYSVTSLSLLLWLARFIQISLPHCSVFFLCFQINLFLFLFSIAVENSAFKICGL